MLTSEKAKRVRTAWFQIQNRISEYINEHLRPIDGHRIELADFEDSSKSSAELLGFIDRSFLELADKKDDPFLVPYFKFSSGASSGQLGGPFRGDVISWQLADYVRLRKEVGVNSTEWATDFVTPIGEWTAEVSDWFERLVLDVEIKYGPNPQKKRIFIWDFQPINVTPTTWKFLLAVWGKKDVAFSEIGLEVWGDDLTKASTIRSRAQKATGELKKHDIDLLFSCEGEKVNPIDHWPK